MHRILTPLTHNSQGESYHRQGQYQRAIEDYDKAIELDPNDAEVRTERGRLFRALNNG